MKARYSLTSEQQKLVEANLHLVNWVIYESISLNNHVTGLEFDDVYQEGCICLCHAAATYISKQAQFDTYAKKVIRNGLISYCRKINWEQLHTTRLSIDEDGNLIFRESEYASDDEFAKRIATFEMLDFLHAQAKRKKGIARLGIEAFAMKVTGASLAEIATQFHAPVNHIGAWISRAVSILRKNQEFLTLLQ